MTATERCAVELEQAQQHPERDKYPELHRQGVTDWVMESALIHEEQAYQRFLESKRAMASSCGFLIDRSQINPKLIHDEFGFQGDIVQWALMRGRAAVFADCGMGKTPIQLEWARLVCKHASKPVLILAPLQVTEQTEREGRKFSVPVTICRGQSDVRDGVNIANYEMLEHFAADAFAGLVLDESSILKSFDGVTRKAITEFGRKIPFRLACTATPAPNDLIELTNHAEFLEILTGKEIIALFFTQDGNTTHKWRLKGHARKPFWEWLASWSVALRMPEDLGYPNGKFVLPKLNIEHHQVESDPLPGFLFPTEAQTLSERLAARRDSIQDRCKAVADLIYEQGIDQKWVVWCNLNAEQDELERLFGDDCVSVRGNDSRETKAAREREWREGETPIMLSKGLIFGFGMNWQHCHNIVDFISDSFEQFYQKIRRCWRFGQRDQVNCYVVAAESEGAVVENIRRKEAQAEEMFAQIVEHMKGLQMENTRRDEAAYATDVMEGDGWTMNLGDSCEVLKTLPEGSVGLSVFSPPFPGMYTYTNSPRDVGNSKTIDELIEHFRNFMIPDLLRVTQPGRHCALHLCQGVAFKGVDGYIGLKDFRGKVIQAMESAGWVYYGEVCIDKDPQVKAIRTKDRGLLFKTLRNDASHLHPALADYLLQFRKPGDSPQSIRAGIREEYENGGEELVRSGWITADEWIEWAAPVWYRHTANYPGGIRETDVLNVSQARENDDERHLCPLQLGVCERAIKLWSNPGDLVLDPFTGIGSVGVKALELGRHFVGVELKRSYFDAACKNLAAASRKSTEQPTLFEIQA